MSKTIRSILQFSFRLILGLVLTFVVQASIYYSIGIPLFDNLIIQSYLINYAMVLFTFVLILWLKSKKSQSLGFVYVGGFFIKLAIFFIFFNPYYKADDIIQKAEFAAFFVPYAICLTYETVVLVKILNRD